MNRIVTTIEFALLFFFVFLLSNCKSKMIPEYGSTFPFSIANEAKIISYPNRLMWDTTKTDSSVFINDGVIAKGEIRLPKAKIRDQIQLNQGDLKELFKILYKESCAGDEMTAACYDPRHAIVFYDKNKKAIGAIEVCFECLNSEVSAGIPNIVFCFDRIGKLQAFMKIRGVKYFGDDD